LLSAHRLIHFERIRDGGSLAADFETNGGRAYTLFFRILSEDGPGSDEITHRGFAPPMIVNRASDAWPPAIAWETIAPYGGPATQVSWAQALELLNALDRSPDLEPNHVEGVLRMQRVAENEGRQPPEIAKVLRFRS
jgi:hypothetical protein